MPPASKKDTPFTRREALKALAAATWAITLTNLPPQWATPVVKVGVLPAQAQTSGLTIANLTVSIPTAGNCTSYEGGPGSRETDTFSYNDPTGNVTDATIIHETARFLPSGFTWPDVFPINDPPEYAVEVVRNGTPFSGTITIVWCPIFMGSTHLEETVWITNSAGVNSNQLTQTALVPPGAPLVGQGTGSEKR